MLIRYDYNKNGRDDSRKKAADRPDRPFFLIGWFYLLEREKKRGVTT